ncbi:MAG TPA: MFS transporter, partial [Propionibacteriaceae bacterium]|nr:MFS transporter [Propionibacteriaceae bacterium]
MASFLDAAALVSSGTSISVLYAPSFHLSPAEIGLVLACQQSSFAVGAMFGGRLGDRLGRRRVLSVALIGFAVGAAILGLANATWMLYVGAICAGLSIGADLPVALAMANEAAPVRKKGRMVVFSQLLWTLGIAFVQLMVSFVGHMGATGARILFGSLVILAILVLVARFALPESPEWAAARTAADSGDADAIKFDQLGQIFRRP